LQLTHGWYFDALNTTEALGFEAATEDLRHPGSIVGPYRRALTNPFALGRRCAIPGISVLTLGRGPEGETRFYLHKRSGERVSVARNVFHVAPAGEFQPADISREALADDFDLWRSIMREYAEEFFGVEDARGRSGRALDYDHRWPMSALQSAKGAGDLKLHFLGLGLDPLTWKPEILVAAVFERETFTEVFADLQTHNEEGTLILGQDGYGIRFDSAAVSRYGEQSGTLAAGQAAIALAWSHRDVLGI
jgi:hypothetical protein